MSNVTWYKRACGYITTSEVSSKYTAIPPCKQMDHPIKYYVGSQNLPLTPPTKENHGKILLAWCQALEVKHFPCVGVGSHHDNDFHVILEYVGTQGLSYLANLTLNY